MARVDSNNEDYLNLLVKYSMKGTCRYLQAFSQWKQLKYYKIIVSFKPDTSKTKPSVNNEDSELNFFDYLEARQY